jgi:hypothetical protein
MAQEQDPVAPKPGDPRPAPTYPEGTSPEKIRQDIGATRARMDRTVDDLEDRLHPRHLLDDLLDLLRGGAGADVAEGAADKARQIGTRVLDRLRYNPVPAALIGAGIAWLVFAEEQKARRRPDRRAQPNAEPPMYSGSYVDARTGEPYDATYGQKYRSGAAAAGAAGQAGHSTVPRQGPAPASAEEAKQRLEDVADSVREDIVDWAEDAYESAGPVELGARQPKRPGYDFLERGIEEYPLAMGAAAMALGVLAGLMMPAARAEDPWMDRAAKARGAGERPGD